MTLERKFSRRLSNHRLWFIRKLREIHSKVVKSRALGELAAKETILNFLLIDLWKRSELWRLTVCRQNRKQLRLRTQGLRVINRTYSSFLIVQVLAWQSIKWFQIKVISCRHQHIVRKWVWSSLTSLKRQKSFSDQNFPLQSFSTF